MTSVSQHGDSPTFVIETKFDRATVPDEMPSDDALIRVGRRLMRRAIEAKQGGQKITHGRHCTCSACAREDWTQTWIAPCGMHGSDCPALYQPLGVAGTRLSASGLPVRERLTGPGHRV